MENPFFTKEKNIKINDILLSINLDKQKIPTVLINGRITKKSYKKWIIFENSQKWDQKSSIFSIDQRCRSEYEFDSRGDF